MTTINPWVLCWSNENDAPTIHVDTIEEAHEKALAFANAAPGNVAYVRTDFSSDGTLYVVPFVGQKVAVATGSDRYQYEVCEVKPNGKTIYIKRGEDVMQARKQIDGNYKLWGNGGRGRYVHFVRTEDYRDPSF